MKLATLPLQAEAELAFFNQQVHWRTAYLALHAQLPIGTAAM